ncbi:MAG: hypothetical protein O2954_06875 [bacterium]|nr:hypothetical protein [bacterium]
MLKLFGTYLLSSPGQPAVRNLVTDDRDRTGVNPRATVKKPLRDSHFGSRKHHIQFYKSDTLARSPPGPIEDGRGDHSPAANVENI